MTTHTATNEVSDKELKSVIADFLEMGHVDNIVSMFKRDPTYYSWSGELLLDERFNVRLGVAILFEELQRIQPEKTPLAIASISTLLSHKSPLFRGEAIGILGTIATAEAVELIRPMLSDENEQVREMARMTLDEA